MLFIALPLAHQACGHVEIASENRLAGAFPQTKGADLSRFKWPYRRKAQLVEFAQRALVHDAGGVQPFGGLVDRRRSTTP